MVSIFKGIFVDVSSRTLPPYIPVGDGGARLVLLRRWKRPEVRGRCGGGWRSPGGLGDLEVGGLLPRPVALKRVGTQNLLKFLFIVRGSFSILIAPLSFLLHHRSSTASIFAPSKSILWSIWSWCSARADLSDCESLQTALCSFSLVLTCRYLHAESHHHPSQKMAVVNKLISRAIAICKPGNLQHEKRHLIRTLVNNGYTKEISEKTFRNYIRKRKDPPKEKADLEPDLLQRVALIPYNRKGCWWWYLMEHFHNNLMKLRGSLGNVPQIMKNLL
jgi:hypothetical protein